MKRFFCHLALIGLLSACGASPTTPPVQNNGGNNNTLATCGTFTTSNDSKGAAFNGQSSAPLSGETTLGKLNGTAIGCTAKRPFTPGNSITRVVRIDLVTTGSIAAGQGYPATVKYAEVNFGVPCGSFGCPTLEWSNTPGSSDVRVESINGDSYRFKYNNVLLTPVGAAKGNLSVTADFSTKLSN
jgi:hypothetical protein